jgi:mgtE-like transporter
MTVYSTKRILKESMPLLSVLIVLEIVGGQILNQNEELLISVPIFLVMIPVINGVGGNIGSIMGARLSSGLHLGLIDLKHPGKELQNNVIGIALLGIISYTILTIFILLITPVLGISTEANLVVKAGYIMISCGLLLISIVIVVSVLVAKISYERGFDPDNVVTPVVTTLCDVLGILILMIIIGAVGV